MVMLQGCKGITGSGPCKASPLRGEKYCFWHHPDHRAEAEQARKLGGQRRKRERQVNPHRFRHTFAT